MIYFARTRPDGPVKIGRTVNLDARMKRLTAELGSCPEILATIPGDVAREQEIHQQFAHHRLGKSEQFRPGDDLMDFIGKPRVPDFERVEKIKIHHPGTRATMVRLTADDLAKFERIREFYGLPSIASAIRRAGIYTRQVMDEMEKI